MRFKFLPMVLLALGASACQPSVAPTAPQTYDLDGLRVEFSPPDKWAMKREHSHPDLVVEAETAKKVPQKDDKWEAMVFESPSGKSRISVVALSNVPKLDKPQLNAIAEAVIKRNGKMTHEYYYQNVAGAKENGFTMEYELSSGTALAERGKQVHFIEKGQLISITLDDPAGDYPQDIGQFDNLVTSINFK